MKPTPWPADRVERRPISTLVPDARNARTHSPEQVAQIAASMREWGWTNPVLVDEAGSIIAGHGRVLAAVELDLSEVPVMVAAGWTEAQKRAYALADNKLALNAGWDLDQLADALRELDEWNFDQSLTGFSVDEIDALFAPENDALAEWRGMPEFEQADRMAFKTIAVHFADADAVRRFAKLIGQPMTDRTRFVWYPQAPKEQGQDNSKRYAEAQGAE